MADKKSKKASWFGHIRIFAARIAPAAFIVGLAVFVESGGEAQDGSSASAGAETQPANGAHENRGVTRSKVVYDRLTPDAVIQDRIAEASKQRHLPADAPVRRVRDEAERQNAAAPPAVVRPGTARAAAGPPDGHYYVSLKSAPYAPSIQRAIPELREKYKSVLGNIPVTMKLVSPLHRVLTYRAAAGPLQTMQEARNLCEKIKTIGGDQACFCFN